MCARKASRLSLQPLFGDCDVSVDTPIGEFCLWKTLSVEGIAELCAKSSVKMRGRCGPHRTTPYPVLNFECRGEGKDPQRSFGRFARQRPTLQERHPYRPPLELITQSVAGKIDAADLEPSRPTFCPKYSNL